MDIKGWHTLVKLIVIVLVIYASPVTSNFKCCCHCNDPDKCGGKPRTDLQCVKRCYEACGGCRDYIHEILSGNLFFFSMQKRLYLFLFFSFFSIFCLVFEFSLVSYAKEM